MARTPTRKLTARKQLHEARPFVQDSLEILVRQLRISQRSAWAPECPAASVPVNSRKNSADLHDNLQPCFPGHRMNPLPLLPGLISPATPLSHRPLISRARRVGKGACALAARRGSAFPLTGTLWVLAPPFRPLQKGSPSRLHRDRSALASRPHSPLGAPQRRGRKDGKSNVFQQGSLNRSPRR